MSSKKIWAASLAAVIAGSSFAVVAMAADKTEYKPTPGGSNGIKVGKASMDLEISDVNKFEKSEMAADGKSWIIVPNKKGGYDGEPKVNITLKFTSDDFKGAGKTLFTASTGEIAKDGSDSDTVTVTIKDYNLQAQANKKTTVKLTATNSDSGDKTDYEFTIDNQGKFTKPTFTYEKGEYVKNIDDSGKKAKDTVLVIYDGKAIPGADAYDDISVKVKGSGFINGTAVSYKEEVKHAAANKNHVWSQPVTLTGDSDLTTNEEDTSYTQTLNIRFVSEEEYADMNDLPTDETEGSKPADESKDESTSSDTVVEKEVTVDVAVGDVTDAGLVLDPAKIFTGDAATASWADVQEIKFTSDKPFALVFSVEKGAVKDKADAETFTKGVDAYKALDKAALATEQTLTAEDAAHVAKSTAKTVTLQTAEGETATVKATVKVKVKTTDTAPNTGIALAIAPAALATAFVTVAAVMSKKKKG